MTRIALMALVAFVLTTENDPRLTVHTIVREDIFAGYMVKDMVRLAKGEAMLERLDKERPDQRQHVRAWQGGAVTFRAVLAYERGDRAEGDRLYSIAQSRFDEALKLGPNDGGVWAVIAAVNGLFADRLPVDKRGAAWNTAYDFYRKLGAQQMATVDKLPSHFRGELLAGLVMSAQRTGHQEEFTISLDKMIELTENTPQLDRPDMERKPRDGGSFHPALQELPRIRASGSSQDSPRQGSAVIEHSQILLT